MALAPVSGAASEPAGAPVAGVPAAAGGGTWTVLSGSSWATRERGEMATRARAAKRLTGRNAKFLPRPVPRLRRDEFPELADVSVCCVRRKEGLVIVCPDCVEDISTVANLKLSLFCQGFCVVKRQFVRREKNVREWNWDVEFFNPGLSKDSVLHSPFWTLLSNPFNSRVLPAFTVAGPHPDDPAAEIQSSEG